MTYIAKPTPRARERKPLKSRPHVIPTSVRIEAFELYEYRCQWCLVEGGALDCHHIKPRSQGGKDRVEDLIVVHRLCHAQIHANPTEAKARGFLR